MVSTSCRLSQGHRKLEGCCADPPEMGQESEQISLEPRKETLAGAQLREGEQRECQELEELLCQASGVPSMNPKVHPELHMLTKKTAGHNLSRGSREGPRMGCGEEWTKKGEAQREAGTGRPGVEGLGVGVDKGTRKRGGTRVFSSFSFL